ncbi:thiopeptide-type bacteriocin biosynthesis domain-containing protein [Amycolatopsis pretoriensis]|uniref:Thiopeptide-type bacteriocin biosynthesis domain-containing protein n=1 Tax=Amycolatopsis pretoriensis TaxID=218821 RepID=A0A1H5RIF2_9PSEU|nr:lantibiotic dehydratase [Amycolatopsis pretoriensis]SEF38109.1 thiopeptide-type bacteriocin biosynthesis domain-containing protein [Amycolatopsis pretoriensis]
MTVSPRYQHVGLLLARVTTDPGDLDPPTWLHPGDPAAVGLDGHAWLAKVWARPEVREAVALASPALGARVDHIVSDCATETTAKELRQAVTSVASYLLRWQRRSTPFGLFAGVGVVDIGPAAATVGTRHRAVARVDSEWLTTLIDHLERHPGLRQRLTVVGDGARIVRDGRVIVHRRADVGAATPGPLRESSVRLTRPVRFALAAAAAPIRFDTLADLMTCEFPSASPSKIDALLHGLVDAGVLITGLRPPMTSVEAVSHLIGALRAAKADTLDDVAAILRDLDAITVDLTLHNHAEDPDQARAIRTAVAARMRALVPHIRDALAVHVRLDAAITLPARVLDEAARAATVLLRTTTQPFGTAAWLDYHARFLARYGPGALVPVRDLIAESGLGYPAGYLGAPRARPAWRALTDRDAALLALIQQTTLSGAREIDLTDTDVDALTVGVHADAVPPQRVELGITVHAASTAAIDRGEFQLRVTAAPRAYTSMAGRFADLLDDANQARLAATYSAPQPNVPAADVVAVQLSFPPRRPHNENVVRVPPLLDNVVSLSEHPDPTRPDLTVIGVDDLAVTADAEQLYLVQISTGRRVIPRVPHALDTSVQSPPLARFLAEVADARSAVFRGFDLGAARVLPYVPRIRYRRTVLAAARWLLSDTDLAVRPEPGGDDQALRTWRQRWQVPVRVVLVHGELRLPIDLDQDLDRALLRARLERAGRIELHEDGPPDGQGWIGRPAELLIPMTAVTPPNRPLPTTAAPGAALQPGDSALVHAQIVGNPARFDEILTAHLPRLAAELRETGDPDGLVASWWVRRHRDMIRPEADQHLAVSLRLTDPRRYGAVAARLTAFAADLDSRGLPGQLTLAPAPQHPARYGAGPALVAAEQVFAADTTAAIAQLTTAQISGTPAQALAAASMAHLAAHFAPDPPTGYRALLGCLRQEHGHLDRELREHALAVADPADRYRAVGALPGGEAVAAAWCARDTALHAYRDALIHHGQEPGAVLRTLLHEHHIRAVGVDPTFEKETGRLARAVALRLLAAVGAR